MLYYTVGQEFAFAQCAFGGVILGALYDVCYGLRKVFSGGKLAGLAADFLCVCVSCAWIFAVLYVTNGGEMRWYAVLGFACGYAAYMLGIHPPMRMAAKKCTGFIQTMLKKATNTRFVKLLLK